MTLRRPDTTLKPGRELGPDTLPIGSDPRRLSRAELEGLGHRPMSPLRALRERCVDCCGDQLAEVRKCTATGCPSWPFRMGSNPWRSPASEAKQEAGLRAAARMRHTKEIARSNPGFCQPKAESAPT